MSRISELIRQERHLFHTKDLAMIWKISNKRTLYNAIQRTIKSGALLPVYKGLYSLIPVERLDELEIGSSICNTYTYMSTETVLANVGWLTQVVAQVTMVAQSSKRINVGRREFYYRQLADKYLLNQIGVKQNKHGFAATPERAVADMLYFQPNYHFDMHDSINWDQVNLIRKQVGYI